MSKARSVFKMCFEIFYDGTLLYKVLDALDMWYKIFSTGFVYGKEQKSSGKPVLCNAS